VGTKVVLSTTLGVWEKIDSKSIKLVWPDEMLDSSGEDTVSQVQPDAFVYVIFEQKSPRQERQEQQTPPAPPKHRDTSIPSTCSEDVSIRFINSEGEGIRDIPKVIAQHLVMLREADIIRMDVGNGPQKFGLDDIGYDVDENRFYVELRELSD
jgi:hypothetical protein